MASLRAIILALLASRVLAAKTNCPANLDVCGWSLTGTYGKEERSMLWHTTTVRMSAAVYNLTNISPL